MTLLCRNSDYPGTTLFWCCMQLFSPAVILPCLMTLSRFFWSNSRGAGGLTESSEKGLGFPNRYQYVLPAHMSRQTKKIKSHISETVKSLILDLDLQQDCTRQQLQVWSKHSPPWWGTFYRAECQRSGEKGARDCYVVIYVLWQAVKWRKAHFSCDNRLQ